MNDELAIKYYNDNLLNKRNINWNNLKNTHKVDQDFSKYHT